jgi:hypothetical protein
VGGPHVPGKGAQESGAGSPSSSSPAPRSYVDPHRRGNGVRLALALQRLRAACPGPGVAGVLSAPIRAARRMHRDGSDPVLLPVAGANQTGPYVYTGRLSGPSLVVDDGRLAASSGLLAPVGAMAPLELHLPDDPLLHRFLPGCGDGAAAEIYAGLDEGEDPPGAGAGGARHRSLDGLRRHIHGPLYAPVPGPGRSPAPGDPDHGSCSSIAGGGPCPGVLSPQRSP